MRKDLLDKLSAAQSMLERVIADLVRSGANTAPADAQMQRLVGLQASVGTASAATLNMLGGEIAAAVAKSQIVAQEARAEIVATNAAELSRALNSAATASRAALHDAMDSLRHTPLTFTSPEEEAEYRQREEARSAYTAAQQAKHTPEGDLNASGAGIGQMVDAKAHGASGPEFEQRLSALMATTEKLREAAKANGVSTEEFDRHLRDDLRRIMKSKGLSDAEIDARFAATPDPLEAAKAYLKSDDDLTQVQKSTRTILDQVVVRPAPIAEAVTVAPAANPALSDVLGKLSMAKLAFADHPVTEDFSHGVSAQGQITQAVTRST